MSDENKNTEDQVVEVSKPSKPDTKAAAKKEKSSKGSSALAWLALLLVLGVIGVGGWLGKQAMEREASLKKRLVALEVGQVIEDTSLDDLSLQWEKRLAVESSKREELAALQALQVREIESRLALQREKLSRFGAADRQDWLLAEAQYLLRLANQRLIMAEDIVAAKTLLNSADSILRELDDVTLHEVRAAIAADLAAVRAVPVRDVQGMYLALAALIEQVDKLVIFQMPKKQEQVQQEPAEDWQDRLQQGYQDALQKISNYIIIRRRDVPIEALMDPQWEALVRQNLRMLLEQAQVALLSANQTLYRESLQRSRHWLGEFFLSDEAAAKALTAEIAVLEEIEISVEVPDISRSLSAVDAVLDGRTKVGGEE